MLAAILFILRYQCLMFSAEIAVQCGVQMEINEMLQITSIKSCQLCMINFYKCTRSRFKTKATKEQVLSLLAYHTVSIMKHKIIHIYEKAKMLVKLGIIKSN